MTTHTTRMLILGSGPAGLSAAIYGARAGMAPIVVQGIQPGGQLTTTTDVENYPGFETAIQGPWLMEQMQKQAEHVGTRIHNDIIMSVDFSRRPFRCVGDGGDIYLADTVVIATGAQARQCIAVGCEGARWRPNTSIGGGDLEECRHAREMLPCGVRGRLRWRFSSRPLRGPA